MNKISQYIFAFLLLVMGLLVGYFLPKQPKKKAGIQVQNNVQNLPFSNSLINPTLPYFEQLGLDYSELNSFRSKIENRIQSEKKIHPDLFVSYYFRDLNNGLWTGINERETFSPASLFKVPLMITLLKRAETDPGVLKLGVTYSAKMMGGIEEEAGFKKEDGKYYLVDDLLTQMICYSDNAASLLLLQLVGDSMVYKTIDDLNMHVGTKFNENTNFVTVKAYAGIFRILYNASFLNKEMSEKALKLLSQAKFDKGIRAGIPSNVVVAQKYGKRDERINSSNLESIQLHHFALVFHHKKPFILGIMTKGANLKAKEDIIRDLAKITYDEVDGQCGNGNTHQVFRE
ncbi:MAG: serine hydrolase [bacterium]|nr:serine hydrolase [bacterium]